MKKEYMKPTTQVVEIQTSQMLAGSGAAQSLGGSNPEKFILDSGGLDDGDDLR